MKSVETSEGCGRQGRRRERVEVQQDNSQVLLKDKDQDKDESEPLRLGGITIY